MTHPARQKKATVTYREQGWPHVVHVKSESAARAWAREVARNRPGATDVCICVGEVVVGRVVGGVVVDKAGA